jgi:hypothetical protein
MYPQLAEILSSIFLSFTLSISFPNILLIQAKKNNNIYSWQSVFLFILQNCGVLKLFGPVLRWTFYKFYLVILTIYAKMCN